MSGLGILIGSGVRGHCPRFPASLLTASQFLAALSSKTPILAPVLLRRRHKFKSRFTNPACAGFDLA